MAVLVAVTSKPGATRGAFGTPPQEETRDRPSSSWGGGGIPPIPKVPIGLPFRASVSASHGLTPKQTPLFLIAPPSPSILFFFLREMLYATLLCIPQVTNGDPTPTPPAVGTLCVPTVVDPAVVWGVPFPIFGRGKENGIPRRLPPLSTSPLVLFLLFSLSLLLSLIVGPLFLPRPPLALGPPCRREGLFFFLPSGTPYASPRRL